MRTRSSNTIDLQRIANELTNAFPDTEMITWSYMSAENDLIQLMSLLDNHMPEAWQTNRFQQWKSLKRRGANDFVEANDSNSETLLDEEDEDIVSISIAVQNFWHNWNDIRRLGT